MLKNAILGASLASLALAHSRHAKRGTVPVDGKIWTSCVTPGTIALTFDDGPYLYTQSIVDQLTAAGHRATFFQNGQNWDSIYNHNATLQSMISGGHQIASHTWSHADLATLTADQITAEMGQLEAAHLAIIGKAPTYMRPPYLSTNDLAITTLKGLGYLIIEVDIDSQDWAEGPIGQIQLSIDWYEGNLTAGGSLSLNHDPYQPTADTFIPAIITYLAGKGLKSVPVGECIGDDAANWYRGAGTIPPVSSTGPAPSSVPVGNGTAPGKPTGAGSSSLGSGYHPTGGPKAGGDTEPGHGPNAGRGALPGHSGQGDWGYTPSAGSPGYTPPAQPTGYTNTSAAKPQPSYYTNAASGLTSITGAFILIGTAALAIIL